MKFFSFLSLMISVMQILGESPSYPYHTIKNAGIQVDGMRTNQFIQTLYTSTASPLLHSSVKNFNKYSASAGEFLLKNCAHSNSLCAKSVEVILSLTQALEKNTEKDRDIIATFILEENKKTTPEQDPIKKLKECGVAPTQPTWIEKKMLPTIANTVHDTAKVLKEKNLEKVAGQYFLDAYKTSQQEGEYAYTFMKTLKYLIKTNADENKLNQYIKALNDWSEATHRLNATS